MHKIVPKYMNDVFEDLELAQKKGNLNSCTKCTIQPQTRNIDGAKPFEVANSIVT